MNKKFLLEEQRNEEYRKNKSLEEERNKKYGEEENKKLANMRRNLSKVKKEFPKNNFSTKKKSQTKTLK